MASAVFAGSLQDKFEKEWQEMELSNLPNVASKELIADDIRGYLQGSKSFYGGIVSAKNNTKSYPDTKYLNMMFDNYNKSISDITNIKKWQKISINDDEYVQLLEKTKMGLCLYNYIAEH